MSVPSTPGPADPLSWTASLDGVTSSYAGARDGIDAVLRDRGRRRTRPEQTTESLLIGAYASAVLEGSVVSLDDFRAGSMDDAAEASARLSTELLGLVPVLKTAPVQAFARLHSLAGKGKVDDDELGRPRTPEAAERLAGLARALTATEQPALLVGAMAHAELTAIAPFVSHNGLIARAVERLVLVARGLDPASLVATEAGHLALRAEYESNLRGYREGGRAGVHAWLLYAPEAFTRAAERSPLRMA